MIKVLKSFGWGWGFLRIKWQVCSGIVREKYLFSEAEWENSRTNPEQTPEKTRKKTTQRWSSFYNVALLREIFKHDFYFLFH